MTANSDPYTYPGTDVLRNKRNIQDAEKLKAFEAQAAAKRIYAFRLSPIEGNFDAKHLRAIHRHIFQDVYPWAGQFRTNRLAKQEYVGGPIFRFTPPEALESEAGLIFAGLKSRDWLRGLQREEFAAEAAKLLASINLLHPFREGNGRTQRLFLESLARKAGYSLAFDVISMERMVEASIRASRDDLAMMTRLFQEILDADRIKPLRRAIEFLDANRFPWNVNYLATTTAGQTYAGKLAGRDGDRFMMLDGNKRIVIGHARDLPADAKSGSEIRFTATWS